MKDRLFSLRHSPKWKLNYLPISDKTEPRQSKYGKHFHFKLHANGWGTRKESNMLNSRKEL